MDRIILTNGGFRFASTERWIFRSATLALVAGQSIRIEGRNGSGKTTLLKVLSGQLPLSEGVLSVAPETSAVYMNQTSGDMLARSLTISEHLLAVAPSVDAARAALRLLGEFELDLHHRHHEFIGHLSGGERQIVALLCTLVAGANVLCLDEFSSALDHRSQSVAVALLRRAQVDSALGLLVVTHEPGTMQFAGTISLSPPGQPDEA